MTHFVAWFSLDQRRQLAHRDGCICCYTHKTLRLEWRKVFGVLIFCEHFEEDILLCNSLFIFQSYEFSKVSLLNTIFKFIGNLIIKRWFQVPYKTILKNIFSKFNMYIRAQ